MAHVEIALCVLGVLTGFDYRDMCFGTEEAMRPTFPELWDQVVPYIKKQ